MIAAGRTGRSRYADEQRAIAQKGARQLYAALRSIERDYDVVGGIVDAESAELARSYFVDLMVTMADRYGSASAANAMELAESVSEAARGRFATGQVAWTPNRDAIEASVRYAMGSLFDSEADEAYTPAVGGVEAFEQRLMDVLIRQCGDASTQSVSANAHGRRVRYRRIAEDGCCEVCQNLADLGWVSDPDSISFQHDGCCCTVECGYED